MNLSVLKEYSYVIFLMTGYSISAGLLVVINKWALIHYPYGANLTALQFSFSALFAWILGVCGIAEVDNLQQGKVWQFMPAVVMFYISVATNLKLLQNANVDTYIVVRACVPLLTCFLDVKIMGSPSPGGKAIGAMFLIVASAAGYIATDKEFVWEAYIWAIVYLVAMAVDTILIKKVVTEVKLSRWGMVYYNNFIALIFFPVGSFSAGDLQGLQGNDMPALTSLAQPKVLVPVLISCIVGVAISFFGLNTRNALTPTAFTVLGVVNKFLTVLVNTVAWSRHSSPLGIGFVILTIIGGIMYQQFTGSQSVSPTEKEKIELPENNPKDSAPVPPPASATNRSASPLPRSAQ
eukprot:TRINITY_DN7956_c0_g1_i1.p1 TRINITY_DN7956_c0_g1~~TRINITY_DN7956_c0_g1_i1.p1  ORF type:complete len:365 (+),score=46.79 TRINITY_DN7956_c0_g1_i1:47-1096(+)